MRRSKRRGEFLHLDIIGGGKTLKELDDFAPSFLKVKYAVLIIDDTIRHYWMFFISRKDDIYHIIIYFINYFINQGFYPAFIRSDWVPELDIKEMQSFLSSKDCKWESSAAYTQHQDKVFERTI